MIVGCSKENCLVHLSSGTFLYSANFYTFYYLYYYHYGLEHCSRKINLESKLVHRLGSTV